MSEYSDHYEFKHLAHLLKLITKYKKYITLEFDDDSIGKLK